MSRWNGVHADERVILRLHANAKLVFFNIIIALFLASFVAVSVLFIHPALGPIAAGLTGIPAGLLALGAVGYALWRYLSEAYTLTENRLIARIGIFRRRLAAISLDDIESVSWDIDLVDKLFGFGTLIIDSRDSSVVVLRDIAQVQRVYVELTALIVTRDEYPVLDDITA